MIKVAARANQKNAYCAWSFLGCQRSLFGKFSPKSIDDLSAYKMNGMGSFRSFAAAI